MACSRSERCGSGSYPAPSYSAAGGTMSRSPRWPGSSSAAFSGPRAASSFARQSFASKTPIRMCRPLKTARQSHGSHRSGDVVYQRELGRQRPGLDEGVDAGRVGVQHRPRLVVQVVVVEPDRRTDLEPAHLHVLLQGVGARVLGPSAVGQQSVVLHVPQPVLRPPRRPARRRRRRWSRRARGGSRRSRGRCRPRPPVRPRSRTRRARGLPVRAGFLSVSRATPSHVWDGFPPARERRSYLCGNDGHVGVCWLRQSLLRGNDGV